MTTEGPTSAGVDDLWEKFAREKVRRWESGRREYRPDPGSPFQGDPIAEAWPELVDFSNYMDEAARQGRISEEERAACEAIAFEGFLACHWRA